MLSSLIQAGPVLIPTAEVSAAVATGPVRSYEHLGFADLIWPVVGGGLDRLRFIVAHETFQLWRNVSVESLSSL